VYMWVVCVCVCVCEGGTGGVEGGRGVEGGGGGGVRGKYFAEWICVDMV
jgi:hypothetical protein